MNNEGRLGKYLMTEESGSKAVYESIDEIGEMIGDIQESIQDYTDGNIDKSQIISVINDLRIKLDDIEDNL